MKIVLLIILAVLLTIQLLSKTENWWQSMQTLRECADPCTGGSWLWRWRMQERRGLCVAC